RGGPVGLGAGDGRLLAHVGSGSGHGVDQALGGQDVQRVLGGGLAAPMVGDDPVAGRDPRSRLQHAVADLRPQVFEHPEIDRVGTGTHPVIVADMRGSRVPMTKLYGSRAARRAGSPAVPHLPRGTVRPSAMGSMASTTRSSASARSLNCLTARASGSGSAWKMRPCRRVLSTSTTPPGRTRGTISSQYPASPARSASMNARSSQAPAGSAR